MQISDHIKTINRTRVIFYAGVTALVAGIVDPLEGSVIIAAGSALVALATHLSHDSHRKIYLISMILIVTGVLFMFYFSSLGGFGGSSELSWWWGLLILPYPAGWILSIVTLIRRLFKRRI
jgi:hypothetical protein